MDEAREQKVKFIDDIGEEFEHNVGNSLVTARTALELCQSGRVFDETEDQEFLDSLRSAKTDVISRLDTILSSEFNTEGGLSRAAIASFREAIDVDWTNPDNMRFILAEFDRLRKPLDQQVEVAQEQLRQSP